MSRTPEGLLGGSIKVENMIRRLFSLRFGACAHWVMGVSVALLVGCCGVEPDAPSPDSGTDDNSGVSTLSSRVEIVRDEYGVPHIEGQDVPSLFFGLGYAQAEDHVRDIARSLVLARGEGARYFGEKAAEND